MANDFIIWNHDGPGMHRDFATYAEATEALEVLVAKHEANPPAESITLEIDVVEWFMCGDEPEKDIVNVASVTIPAAA